MKWQKIVIHHSASPTTVLRGQDILPVDNEMIREWHIGKGWSDIGYHYLILPDGTCEEGRPLTRQGAHCAAGHRNFIGIGICLVGNFNLMRVPEAQFNGLIKKMESLMVLYNITLSEVELHREVPGTATECPGKYFPVYQLRSTLEYRSSV